jgi:TonB family protein
VKWSPLYIGIGISLALHGILILSASQLERPDVRQQMRTVKLRMVKKAKEERDETKKKKEIQEALKKLEMEDKRKLKEATPEDLKKVKEAQEKLAELRKKLAEEAKKRREELEKKKPEPKPEPKPEVKPEVKPPPEEKKKPAEKKPEQTKKKKRRKQRSKSKKKAVKPAEGEKPAPPTPEMAGAKKGAAIDLEYTMKGGTSSSDKGGSAVNVQAGDGMDIPEEGYNDDPDTALSEQPEEGSEDGEEFQEEFQEPEEDALPDEDEKLGPGGGPIKGKRKKDSRARKVRTTSKHRVTRKAKMKEQPAPKYPDELRALEIQGRVYVLVTVDKEGKVADVTLKKGLHPKLDEVAIEAAWKLEFEPAMKEGEPVGVKITVPFAFVLR